MRKTQLLNQLERRGFSKNILKAFAKVKRENFISADLEERAYEDTALPIGQGQTISQPYTIALMLSLLKIKKAQKILEIGSGCGYVLALISEIVGEKGKVFGIELNKELADKSGENLKDYENIGVYNRNGFSGLEEKAPFDRILISAALKEIPESLCNQLKQNGIIVAPLGSSMNCSLAVLQKDKDDLVVKKTIHGFSFVPFV